MSRYVPPAMLGIPWDFGGSGSYHQWSWNEPGAAGRGAFDAMIARTGRDFRWTVRTVGGAVLGRGAGTDKDDCEMQVLTTLGKSFARLTLPLDSVKDLTTRAATRARITAAAKLYRLADGEERDLTSLDSRLVVVTLIDASALTGTLRVGEWSLVLDTGEVEVDIHPAHVATIERVP